MGSRIQFLHWDHATPIIQSAMPITGQKLKQKFSKICIGWGNRWNSGDENHSQKELDSKKSKIWVTL